MQVQLDVPHHTMMLELHQRVHPKHTVVGWFSTGVHMSARDALIHHFYSKGKASGCGTRAPMYLQVDTELTQDNRLGCKAHVYRKLVLGGQELAAEFVEVPTSVLTTGPEGLALDALREEKIDAIPGDSENFRKSFATLQELIGQAHEYVTDVVDGRREADVTIGRCAAGAAASCTPRLCRTSQQRCPAAASFIGSTLRGLTLLYYLHLMRGIESCRPNDTELMQCCYVQVLVRHHWPSAMPRQGRVQEALRGLHTRHPACHVSVKPSALACRISGEAWHVCAGFGMSWPGRGFAIQAVNSGAHVERCRSADMLKTCKSTICV